MPGRRSVLRQGVVQLPKLVNSAKSMAPLGSALSATAQLLPDRKQKETATGTAGIAARKCARRKAALLLPEHVVSVPSTVLKASASLMAAPPTQTVVDLRIASYMAVEERSRAPWQVAPPLLPPGVSAPSTVAVQANVGSQAAPTRWSAGSRPARRTVGRVTAHFQIAGQLQTRLVATVPSIPASKACISIHTANYIVSACKHAIYRLLQV